MSTGQASCGGFSFVKDASTSGGICRFHESVSSPDGNPDATCYILSECQAAEATLLAASVVRGEARQVAMTAAPVWSLDDISIRDVGRLCNDNSGAVGFMIENLMSSELMMCLPFPPKLAFTAPYSFKTCNEGLKCMSMACPSNSIYIGCRGRPIEYTPCSNGFSSSVATLDSSDCHVVEGDLQPSPFTFFKLVQWRYCNGNDTHFYVMTEVQVTPTDNTIDIISIKCCRIKPL
ncbi:uncharacterized protein LOC123513951 [Portunus trituberculatus]|uniref:uncharacterized protein LOC123513951 n=1 Tax=Portunus trituberculatus TaxID=210409 RepID=UPI001E1CC3A5|nr:uncharacterized protein LOC123513951 [Portunus trituberculatus]